MDSCLIRFWILSVFTFTQAVREKKFYIQSTSQTLKVISELPSFANLTEYLGALKRLINFLMVNKQCVDFSMKFALFLLNVNLRSFAQEKNLLPAHLRKDLQYLTEQADMLHKYFDNDIASLMTNNNPDEMAETNNMYLTMLTDDALWSKHILKLDLELIKEVYSDNYAFPDWKSYLTEVNDFGKWMPNIGLSNICLEILSKNNVSNGSLKNCELRQDCLEMLDYGINFGYALSFKLLFLILARFSRHCTVFSELQDERIRHHLCKDAYRESEFIADNGFQKVDLMAEHIGFCTLDGHAQFLRKPWVGNLLLHQMPQGYFSPIAVSSGKKALNSTDKKTTKTATEASPKTSLCLDHINAVVVGALSAAIRFVLENYH